MDGLQRVSGCDPTQSGVAAGVQSTQCWNVHKLLIIGIGVLSIPSPSLLIPIHTVTGQVVNLITLVVLRLLLSILLTRGGWNDVDPTRPFYGIIEIHTSPDVTDGTFCWAGSLGAQTCGVHPCDYAPPANGGNGTCNDKLSSGSTCIPTCAQGYTLTPTATGSLSAQCIDGEIVQPSCQASPW